MIGEPGSADNPGAGGGPPPPERPVGEPPAHLPRLSEATGAKLAELYTAPHTTTLQSGELGQIPALDLDKAMSHLQPTFIGLSEREDILKGISKALKNPTVPGSIGLVPAHRDHTLCGLSLVVNALDIETGGRFANAIVALDPDGTALLLKKFEEIVVAPPSRDELEKFLGPDLPEDEVVLRKLVADARNSKFNNGIRIIEPLIQSYQLFDELVLEGVLQIQPPEPEVVLRPPGTPPPSPDQPPGIPPPPAPPIV